jgi:hypothetical protein
MTEENKTPQAELDLIEEIKKRRPYYPITAAEAKILAPNMPSHSGWLINIRQGQSKTTLVIE